MNASPDLPARLFRRTARVTLNRSAPWENPTIQTSDYCRASGAGADAWPGIDTAPNTAARCTPAPHYEAILAEAARVGWPTAYRRDLLVHDRNILGRLDPATPFVFVLRDKGTHVFPVKERDGVGHGASHFAVSCPDTFGRDHCKVYTWDGARLREHETPETAAERAGELERGAETGNGACFRGPNAPDNAWYKHHTACESVTGKVQP